MLAIVLCGCFAHCSSDSKSSPPGSGSGGASDSSDGHSAADSGTGGDHASGSGGKKGSTGSSGKGGGGGTGGKTASGAGGNGSSADAGTPTDPAQCAKLPSDQAAKCLCDLVASGYQGLPASVVAACPSKQPDGDKCCYQGKCCSDPQICLQYGTTMECVDRPAGCNDPVQCSCFKDNPCTKFSASCVGPNGPRTLNCGFQ